jgi:hypothetical protein
MKLLKNFRALKPEPKGEKQGVPERAQPPPAAPDDIDF